MTQSEIENKLVELEEGIRLLIEHMDELARGQHKINEKVVSRLEYFQNIVNAIKERVE